METPTPPARIPTPTDTLAATVGMSAKPLLQLGPRCCVAPVTGRENLVRTRGPTRSYRGVETPEEHLVVEGRHLVGKRRLFIEVEDHWCGE